MYYCTVIALVVFVKDAAQTDQWCVAYRLNQSIHLEIKVQFQLQHESK
jgi:hypothetical protein